MTLDNNMGRFFEWLIKPLDDDDVKAWHLANNIRPELTDLFRDFCFSFMEIIKDTYLGDDFSAANETKVGMTLEQKKGHFIWCWKKNVENFGKENIVFNFKKEDIDFFEGFFFEVFYNQPDNKIKETMDDFFYQIFDKNGKKTKSDLEIFTDIYKLLERSIK